MAILRVNAVTSISILLLTCIGSTKLAVAWVLRPPQQQQRHEIISSRLGQKHAVCYSSAQENGRIEKEGDNNNDDTSIEPWDHQVIRWVDSILEEKSEQKSFAIESLACNDDDETSDSVPFEWIVAPKSGAVANEKESVHRKIALRTTGAPLLDAESIVMIREAAQDLWDRHQSLANNPTTQVPSSSRFTLQFEDTNSECHLEELVASDASGKLRQTVDHLLTTKVYPLVRSAFGRNNNNDQYGLTDGNLCVYDSLVVRYNGDKATDRFGASQPLHVDGGVISVNIALNSHRGDDEKAPIYDTFSGGGTFFEDLIQLDDADIDIDADADDRGIGTNKRCDDPILRPSSTGQALAHWSTTRHAGAPTRSGTRDILVIFLTQRKDTRNYPQDHKQKQQRRACFNGIERSFHLTLKARELPVVQRGMALRCLDLAINKSPFDAQAHFWKGFHLMQGGPPKPKAKTNDSETQNGKTDEEQWWEELGQSIYNFERAKDCAPLDAKISCYAGMAYRQRWMFAQQKSQQRMNEREDLDRAADCLERALLLHEKYRKHGISSDFDDNANTARITLGEVYMQQDRYETAIEWLSSIGNNPPSDETQPSVSEAMKQHISKLITHCHQQNRDANEEYKPERSVVGTASHG